MIIKNILRGLSPSAPRPDVMYDGGIIMKKRRKQGLWLRRNLPLLIAAAALVLLILIIVLVAKGCSKTSDTTIQAEAFSTKTTIGLPVSAELNSADFVSYGGYQFTTKKSLSAMSKLVTKNNDGVTAESFTNSYGTCAVFTKANESGGTDTWCLYAKDPQNTKNWYIFMGEHRELALESGTLDLLLPLHLITDAELLDTMFATLQPGTPYTCGLDKLPDGQTLSSLFRTFYETSGLYTVTGSDSGFTLVPRGGARKRLVKIAFRATVHAHEMFFRPPCALRAVTKRRPLIMNHRMAFVAKRKHVLQLLYLFLLVEAPFFVRFEAAVSPAADTALIPCPFIRVPPHHVPRRGR